MIKIKTEITDKGVIQTLVDDAVTPTVTVDRTINRGLASITDKALFLFVDDVLGNDNNSGLKASKPLATIVRAEQLIPDRVRHPVLINIEPHGSTGYTWPLFGSRDYAGEGDIWVNFPNFNEIQVSTGSLAGSSISLVKSTGLVVDQYVGKTIEILSGDAAGDRRTIRNNTTTDIVGVVLFRAAVSTDDLYRIIEPVSGNVIIPPTGSAMVQGNGIADDIPYGRLPINVGLHIVNGIIKPVGTECHYAQGARIFLHGTEISSSQTHVYHVCTGQIIMGRNSWTEVPTPFNSSSNAWVGWGATWINSFPVFDHSGHVTGYVVAPRWITMSGRHVISGRLVSGPLRAIGQQSTYDSRPPQIIFGTMFNGPTPSMITNTNAAFPAVNATYGSEIILGMYTEIESAQVCVLADSDSSIRMRYRLTLTTGSDGFVATRRGTIGLSDNITVGTLTGAELSVGLTPTTGTLASVSNKGDYLTESGSLDGTMIYRYF